MGERVGCHRFRGGFLVFAHFPAEDAKSDDDRGKEHAGDDGFGRSRRALRLRNGGGKLHGVDNAVCERVLLRRAGAEREPEIDADGIFAAYGEKGHVVVRRAVLVCVEISKPQDGVFRVRIRLRAQNFRAVLNETVGKSIRKSVQLAVFDDGGKAVMTVRIGAQRKDAVRGVRSADKIIVSGKPLVQIFLRVGKLLRRGIGFVRIPGEDLEVWGHGKGNADIRRRIFRSTGGKRRAGEREH